MLNSKTIARLACEMAMLAEAEPFESVEVDADAFLLVKALHGMGVTLAAKAAGAIHGHSDSSDEGAGSGSDV